MLGRLKGSGDKTPAANHSSFSPWPSMRRWNIGIMLSLSAVFVIQSLRYPSRVLQEFTLRSDQDVLLVSPFYGNSSDSNHADYHHSAATKINASSTLVSNTTTSRRKQNASADRIDFTKLVSEATSPPWALFYNIFVPLNENNAVASSGTANHTSPQRHLSEAQRGALNIIREQLGQIRHSYAAQRYYASHNKTLHELVVVGAVVVTVTASRSAPLLSSLNLLTKLLNSFFPIFLPSRR